MKSQYLHLLVTFWCCCTACNVVEKSSSHGFGNGIYTVKHDSVQYRKAYLALQEDTIRVYEKVAGTLQPTPALTITPPTSDMDCKSSFTFKKQSLDIDITSILFKYRPGQGGNPPELTADFNAALYSGWRWDYFTLKTKKDPLQNCRQNLSARGFDVGGFAGIGTTPVNPFTTGSVVSDDYSGMILQYGLAGFVETTFVSFGLAAGFDVLLTPDKKSWVYHNKPWVGFIVGIALN